MAVLTASFSDEPEVLFSLSVVFFLLAMRCTPAFSVASDSRERGELTVACFRSLVVSGSSAWELVVPSGSAG